MLPIFAQRNNANGPPDELLVGLLVGVCAFYLVLLIVFIFFLMSLQRTLGQCRSANQTMPPGHVWLNLIPLFNLVWMFITVIRIGESLENEFRDRGWHRRGEDYGKGLGLSACGLALASNIPYLGCVIFLGWIVCFILYWMKIAGYGTQLASRRADYDDDYDDRPRRKSRREDDEDDRPRRRRDEDDDDEDDRRGGRPWDRGGR